jgi:hypothetical protein
MIVEGLILAPLEVAEAKLNFGVVDLEKSPFAHEIVSRGVVLRRPEPELGAVLVAETAAAGAEVVRRRRTALDLDGRQVQRDTEQ